MTDDLNAEFNAIVNAEHSRIQEQQNMTKVLGQRLRCTPDMAAAVVRQLDTTRPGQLSRIAGLLRDDAGRGNWLPAAGPGDEKPPGPAV